MYIVGTVIILTMLVIISFLFMTIIFNTPNNRNLNILHFIKYYWKINKKFSKIKWEKVDSKYYEYRKDYYLENKHFFNIDFLNFEAKIDDTANNNINPGNFKNREKIEEYLSKFLISELKILKKKVSKVNNFIQENDYKWIFNYNGIFIEFNYIIKYNKEEKYYYVTGLFLENNTFKVLQEIPYYLSIVIEERINIIQNNLDKSN